MANGSLEGAPEGALLIARDRMRPNPSQPRTHFDKASLRELAESISEIGQTTPVELRPLSAGDTHDFEITDGERRWIACKAAKVGKLLAWINPIDDEDDVFVRSVVANFGREGHTPLETARAIRRILESKRLQKCRNRTEQLAMIARMFARSPAWVHTHLGILNLHEGVLALMESSVEGPKRIGSSIATFLNTITDRDLQFKIAKQVSAEGLNLRQARALVRKKAQEAGLTAGKRGKKPSDHYRTLTRFLATFRINAGEIMEMPVSSFEQIFRRRSPKQQRETLELIEKTVNLLTELEQALSRTQKRG
ncbi:MAG: ParB/RepB/Spo0J family partition protein [Patescibacteria group bacterium]|nr:ParB/RepB/Spo0J family partition protein [Patescibacteria group bacterium]